MLDGGEQNFIAGFQKFSSPTVGDEIDRFGRAAREDDALRRGGSDKLRHFFARAFILRRRFLAQGMDAAMDIGVCFLIKARFRVDHGKRLLRRGRIVEINERLAMDLAG